MNGTMKRKSRYSTFNAHNHNPAPMAAPKASAMNSGRDRIRQSGQYLYQAIIATKIEKEIRRSTKPVMTEAAGTMRRGK